MACASSIVTASKRTLLAPGRHWASKGMRLLTYSTDLNFITEGAAEAVGLSQEPEAISAPNCRSSWASTSDTRA